MKKKGSRILSWLLSLALCICLIPAGSAQAAGDAMSLNEVKQLLNGVELHPQRTGYLEMDRLLENMLKPYAGKDNYTKLKAMYDWTVENIDYSWEGYSQDWAPAYDKFTLKYDLTYEPGLQKAFPEEIINRSYHALTAKRAVCYDWGALFAVMARYVGVESYVHTGELQIGTWRGHHGWTVLKIKGVNYIFDAQQDNRLLTRVGYNPHEHFGIAPASAGRWTPETAVNAARDKGFLPVTAERVHMVTVTAEASRSGKVTGGGRYLSDKEVTLTAEGDVPLVGWYDKGGELLSQDAEYTFIPKEDTTIRAMFEGDYFFDVPDTWYTEDVCAAAELGLIQGMAPVTFAPKGNMTRAMLATVLSRVDGADVSAAGAAPFVDVPQDAWYAQAVNWAYENDVVNGVSETKFDPMGIVTREQAATMMMRYLEKQGITGAGKPLEYTDTNEISDYARESIARAQDLDLMNGYADGTVRPKKEIIRSEGAVMIMRLSRRLAEPQE